MKKWKRGLKKGLAYLLIFSMVLSASGIPTLTVNASEGITVSDSCEHHTEHNEECGYIEGVEGSPCTHEHDDSCYTTTTICVHEHTDGCCEAEGTVSGNDVEAEGAAVDAHECTEESGCVTKELNCQHTHDENCGYVEAVEGQPCTFVCTDCVECTCGTDDASIHATNCPAYVAPENPECFCVEKCTEETANIWCDVCGFDYTACKGTESVALYDGCVHEAGETTTVENGICTVCQMYGWCGEPANADAPASADNPATDKVIWSFDEDTGTLTISATETSDGAMADYESIQGSDGNWVTTAPWIKYKDKITSLVVGEGVTVIGNFAFCYLSITNVELPGSLDETKMFSFYECKDLTSVVVPEGVETLGDCTFAYCENLKSIELPSTLETIKMGVFRDCSSLEDLEIPTGVTSIDYYTFMNCTALNRLVLPASITNVTGSNIFTYVTGNVYFLGENEPSFENDLYGLDTCTFYVGHGYTAEDFGGKPVVNGHFEAGTGNSYLEYTVDGNTITETCTYDGCGHTATATLKYNENNLVYDGTNKAYVEYDDNWTSGKLKINPSNTADVGEYPNVTLDLPDWFGVSMEKGVSFTVTKGDYDLILDVSQGDIVIDEDTISYGDNKSIPHESGMQIGITGTTDLYSVIVKKDVSANIILAGVNINGSKMSREPILIEDDSTGDVTITIADGTTNILQGGTFKAGVNKNGAYSETLGTLTIKGGEQGTGILNATGGGSAAGIGGGTGDESANIIITGGIVNAGSIGGGDSVGGSGERLNGRAGTHITISGGIVTTSRIGGGAPQNSDYSYGATSDITITGGSVKVSSIGCTPTDGTNDVYLLTIANPDNETVTIKGKEYPSQHSATDTNVYVYLPAKTATDPNVVTVGDETTKYIYDTVNSTWLEVVEVDIPVAPTKTFTYDGTEQTYLVDTDYYTVTNGKQTNAGTYTVTVTPKLNVVWSDGTNEVKEYEFVINPATGTGSVTMDDWTYGETAKTPNPSSDTNSTDNVTYIYESTDGKGYSSSVAPTNAGAYKVTATFAATSNYTECTATDEFTIAKATPDIGTVSVEPQHINNSTDITELTLYRTNEDVDGELTFAEGSRIWYGPNELSWVFTPTGEDANNYNVLTSDNSNELTVFVHDTEAPTLEYHTEVIGWKKFINTVTLGMFCKDYVEVKIQCTDEATGVYTFEYYISSTGAVENTEDIEWTQYSFEVNADRGSATVTKTLDGRGNYVIYARATDCEYNETGILSSEQIVVFNDSVADKNADIEITYGSDTDMTTKVQLNGNTVKDITVDGTSIGTDNYSVAEDGTITIKGDYLKTLDANATGYTYTVSYYPMGVAGVATLMSSGDEVSPADTTFKVVVKPQIITATVSAENKHYDGDATATVSVTSFEGLKNGDILEEETDYTVEGTFENPDAGENKAVTVTVTLADTVTNYTFANGTEAEFETTASIGKANAEITLSQASYEKTYGDDVFNLVVTENNTDANGKLTYSSSNEAVITVDENGNVTIKGAGEATITVTLAETTNYNEAASKTITVDVAKKAYSMDAITKNYLYSKNNADSINLEALLPSDCGKVTFDNPVASGAVAYESVPSIADGILSYTIQSGAEDTIGTITVTAEMQNYESVTFTVTVNLLDKIPVKLKDGNSVTLKSNTLTYGQALSTLTFNETEFVGTDGNAVTGKLTWKTPTEKPDVTKTLATWFFTPDSELYATLEGTVAIKVNKATPEVTALPTVADIDYHPNTKLSYIALSGGTVSVEGTWSWQTGSIVPTVDNSGYVAVFTPTDTTRYEVVTKTIAMQVSPVTPHIEMAPTAEAITYGEMLSDHLLSEGRVQYSQIDETAVSGSFSWQNANTKPVCADSDKTEYTIVFTPADNVNYKTAETKITITVNKAGNTPNMPGDTINTSYNNKTVGAVELPDGWVWQESDKDVALEVGEAVSAIAIYNGADKGNYVTESVTITITRSECTHANTEVRNASEATCEKEGYTGDTYCLDCDSKEPIEKGTAVPKKDHTYDEGKVTKEPTATEEGEKTYTCGVCGTTKTEKLPATGEEEKKIPVVGEEITSEDGKAVYVVTDSSENGGTVTYTAPTDKSAKSVTVPATIVINGVTYKVTAISDTAFAGNTKLTEVVIGDNVTAISAKTFKGCKNLTSITIGDGVTSIPANAFKDCKNLKTIIIGNGVKSIPANTFKNFKKLVTVKMGTGVKTIGKNAFYGCAKLKNVTIGKNVTTIGDKAFYKCTSLTKLTIPSKVKTIGKEAFSGCKKLKTLTIGKNVSKIGAKAFYGCKELKNIKIKTKKLTSKKVGKNAFKGVGSKYYKKVVVKVPGKKYVSKYKKLLQSRGLSKKAKVKK